MMFILFWVKNTHCYWRVNPLYIALIHQDLSCLLTQLLHLALLQVLASFQPFDLRQQNRTIHNETKTTELTRKKTTIETAAAMDITGTLHAIELYPRITHRPQDIQ